MGKLEVGNSLETLRFFEKKFTDLFNLIPQLEAAHGLENHINELKKAVSFYEIEVKKQSDKKAKAEADFNKLSADLEQANLALTASKKEALLLIKDGKEEAKSLKDRALQEGVQEGRVKASEFDILISKKAAQAADLEQKISQKTKELDNIESAIKTALSKLGV